MGVASSSFNVDATGKFFFRPNLSIKGITPATLKDFSTDFIFDGTCYKSLSDISARNPHTGEYKQKGYIFAVSYLNLKIDFFLYNTQTLQFSM